MPIKSSLLQQPGPNKFKLFKIGLIYIRPKSLKFPRSLSKKGTLRNAIGKYSGLHSKRSRASGLWAQVSDFELHVCVGLGFGV